jgi:hypothetical protein
MLTSNDAYTLTPNGGQHCAHVIKHASGPEDAVFELRAGIAGGRVELAVRDLGRWRPPGPGEDGVRLRPHAGAQ